MAIPVVGHKTQQRLRKKCSKTNSAILNLVQQVLHFYSATRTAKVGYLNLHFFEIISVTSMLPDFFPQLSVIEFDSGFPIS